ncbi:NAD-dependent deacylase [Marinilabiliaceae bacterium JC017]|nr:NAD-dependent deacylase [Marinilabiliaceae bacterium JC017]
MSDKLERVASLLENSRYAIAFTGAGISVESGIPPFRGENGIWNKYDPKVLDIDYFFQKPEVAWMAIKEIFYEFFGKAIPNEAHLFLANAERKGWIKSVVTQNIDNLHQLAGSKEVYEFHGNAQKLVCTQCHFHSAVSEQTFDVLPVLCPECHSLMKPDFVFFGEGIPQMAYDKSMEAARQTDLVIVVGALGEVMPAAMIPLEAKRNGATIVEINPEPTNFTKQITDIHISGKAGEVFKSLSGLMNI